LVVEVGGEDLLPPPAGGTSLQREAGEDKPPLLERLNGILKRDMPEHVKQGKQPPWADAAMERAASSEQKGQISFI
jgi:hypothetical protein